MKISFNIVLLSLITLSIVGCGLGKDTFTLYRNSIIDEKMRIHVASFNSVEGEAYNKENCELAQQLFQAQPEVKTKFWCENGNFKK